MTKKRKTIEDKKTLLKGQTECITMVQLREGPGDVITQIQMGKRFILTRSGKPVAVMHKPSRWEISKFGND